MQVAHRGPGDKGRTAIDRAAAKRVRIARPENGLVEHFPKTIELSLVEGREVNAPRGRQRFFGGS